MSMAADSNMNSHHGVFPSSFCNQHVVSFQSGSINSTAVLQGGISSGGINNTSGVILSENPSILNNTSAMMLQGNPQSNLFLEPMAGLKHDTGLAADWSEKEQVLLNHGLLKYADQPRIMKYIKIASLLPEKTVRDVALRCRWMSRKETGKWIKHEEFYTGKNFKDMKEKMVDCSYKLNTYPIGNMSHYPHMMHHVNHSNQFWTEAPVINDATRRLIEENVQFFGEIAANLERFKVHDNVELFLRTRNNITAILNSMSEMPGIISQMPPLPVTINEDLFATFLPSTSQAFMFSSPTGIAVKKEPRC